MKPIKVLLADDHTLVRAGLRLLLQDCEDIEIVAEAKNGREALKYVDTLHPNVVLMDIMMPEMNGLDATARIAAAFPQTRVIILSMSASEEYVLQALRAGAAGYLLKDVDPAELEQAVRAVARGEKYLTPIVCKQVVEGYLQRAETQTSLEKLTPRQREVLQLIAEGNSTKQIAKKLNIAVKTAETHRTQLMDALDIHEIAGLVRYAVRMGVVSAER